MKPDTKAVNLDEWKDSDTLKISREAGRRSEFEMNTTLI